MNIIMAIINDNNGLYTARQVNPCYHADKWQKLWVAVLGEKCMWSLCNYNVGIEINVPFWQASFVPFLWIDIL